MSPLPDHRRELRQLLQFAGVLSALCAVTYVHPAAVVVRPWLPGEPVPLVHLVGDDRVVVESADGGIRVETDGGADALPPGLQDGDTAAPIVEEEEFHPDEFVRLSPAEVDLSSGESTEVQRPVAVKGAVPGSAAPAAVAPAQPPTLAEVEHLFQPRSVRPRVATPIAPEVSAVPAASTAVDLAGTPDALTVVVDPPPEALAVQGLPIRAPARPTPLEVPAGGLDAWFSALARAEANEPGQIARALHWGDSTIAADGLTRTVRKRLQSRFGDGGPGFLPVAVDPRWSARPGVTRTKTGDWKTRNVTFGGAQKPYYGLSGFVSTAYGAASSTLGGLRVPGSESRQPLHRFDVFYQVQPQGGTLYAKAAGREGVALSSVAEAVGDAFYELLVPEGAETLSLHAGGDGPVTLYGVALETAGPGVTWETLGVAGASTYSLQRNQAKGHLGRQISRRDPDLIVYQMGGNELGYPSVKSGDGKVYKESYKALIQRLRAAAPNASCLLITPLDQGERYRNSIQSKPALNNMINVQRAAASELGCAFWDARAAMGGNGSMGRWLNKKLAWADLFHLTEQGLSIIGNTLSDAMLLAYDQWRMRNPGGGASVADPSSGGGDGSSG